jgi:hypothetical protein
MDPMARKLRKGRDRCTATRRDGRPCQASAVAGTPIQAGAYLIERADRERVAELVHRRMSRGGVQSR